MLIYLKLHRWIGLSVMVAATFSVGAQPASEGPNLKPRITQEAVETLLPHTDIRRAGFRIFATPFNHYDGLGDGPINSDDTVSFGSRPTLQNNGMFLRINGLDSQTCLECHSILSNAQIPAKFGVGGAGGVGANAMLRIVNPDGDDSRNNGFAEIGGRFINPPSVFGAGGVELLAKEMTEDLQHLKNKAQSKPGKVIDLTTKGVNFGTLVFRDGQLDHSNVQGVQDDLVIRPFGRKGCCFSIRDFDIGAMQFHHGIQPVEVVGENVDADGDGVVNEILPGELSALHIYLASLETPRQENASKAARKGKKLFNKLGCAGCHKPTLVTRSKWLPVSFPENPENPRENVFFEIDLTQYPTGFLPKRKGVAVPLFADLKLHDMGPGLGESTGDDSDTLFTTARLWGVADTAPYLHDGRAVTLDQAILMHGGEAQAARDNYAALNDNRKEAVLQFLRTLKSPNNPNSDL